jgi:hypothetical protein
MCFSLSINYSFGQKTPQLAIEQMGRGINIGNTMDPNTEGGWNNGPVQEHYFDDYKSAGFTNIRIPITWQGHTATTAPYAINAAWMDRVEQVVDWGLQRGLIITINAHHDGFIKDNYSVQSNQDRFDSIWSQIATRFKDKSDSLLFEIINEPKGLTQSEINELNERVLSIIRETNPTRIVIYSGNEWSSVDRMIAAAIPLNDPNLIAYFHSYDPWPFGLEGTGSYSTSSHVAGTKNIFDKATNWSTKNNIPVVIGEFGAINRCDYNSRMYCYATVVEQALNHNIAFDAWDDGGDFQIYKRSQRKWNEIKDVLIYTYKESPTKLNLSQPANDSIVLNWTNRSTENDSIVIERKTSINAEFAKIASVGPTMDIFTDTDVSIGNIYYYRLRTNIKDSIYPMSYPISISTPYFKTKNADNTVSNTFEIKLLKATDPDTKDVLTYTLKLADGSQLPNWASFDKTTVNLKNRSITPVEGTYPLVLTATDQYGQMAKDTFNITVDLQLSVNKTDSQSSINVYPIPAKERLSISQIPFAENIELSLIDFSGRTVFSKNINNLESSSNLDIDLSNVTSGVYILKLCADNFLLNKKIIVTK